MLLDNLTRSNERDLTDKGIVLLFYLCSETLGQISVPSMNTVATLESFYDIILIKREDLSSLNLLPLNSRIMGLTFIDFKCYKGINTPLHIYFTHVSFEKYYNITLIFNGLKMGKAFKSNT